MKSAVVICPGRGTYNAAELGYLARHFPDSAMLSRFDAMRSANAQQPVCALDRAEGFSAAEHLRGDNAAALIFAASLGDFLAIDRSRIEIVAVTGNSMGWYTALACAGALSPEDGFRVANTMGTLMHTAMIGGQLIYPWLDDDWAPDPGRKEQLLNLVARIDRAADASLFVSIELGGMLVLAGDEAGLAAFEAAVEPVQQRFPMRLDRHAAFHSPMQLPVARQGRAALPAALFGQPKVPLIDGRAAIWNPRSTVTQALHDYTLGAQVVEPFDFTRAVTVAAREFAPDLFIVLGPGTTLGGAVAQSLILADWEGLSSRDDFRRRQDSDPLVASMGMASQRRLVVAT